VAELASAETSHHTIFHINTHSLKQRNVKTLLICFYACKYEQSDYFEKRVGIENILNEELRRKLVLKGWDCARKILQNILLNSHLHWYYLRSYAVVTAVSS
jgi:hypothetical protein